jgi:hypothetical protein
LKLQLATILQKRGILSSGQLEAAQKRSEKTHQPFPDIIINELKVPEEAVAEALANHYRIPYLRLAAASVDPEAAKLLSE